MANSSIPAQLRKHEVPGRVAIVDGNGGLPKIKITANHSSAEIYLHGGHVTHFQKSGEPPLIFLSAKSHFAPGEAIRGGVPICFPWFGPREGEPAHGLARLLAWELAETTAANNGSVVVRLRLPKELLKPEWSALKTEFAITVAETLTMELTAANQSPDKTVTIEDCLHSYFHVGDIGTVSLSGLERAPFDDFAFGANGARRNGDPDPLRITQETNRVYPDNAAAVEIRDETLKRIVRVEKFNSKSTVVWNPWTTQKMPDDWEPGEHRQMVCVESGNVKRNKISLAPGKTTTLRVILSSRSI
jgi:D-hexose-6-phosphate mutarotase